MIVFVFDPLAVLILISVTGNHKKKPCKPIDKEELVEEEVVSNTYNIYLEDEIEFEDNIIMGITRNKG